MKRKLFNILSTLLIGASSVCVLQQNNKVIFNNEKKLNVIGRKFADPRRINYVSVSDYGPPPTEPGKFRQARLDIEMTRHMYNLFAITINGNKAQSPEEQKRNFLSLFLGPIKPWLSPDWIKIQNDIKEKLEIASKARKQPPTTFYNLFVHWLNSDEGWKNFRNVFLAIDTSNSTYYIPPGTKTRDIQFWFRSEGAVLQFNFSPINVLETVWRVCDLWQIFPATDLCYSLRYYYRDGVVKGGKNVKVPPLMNIKLPERPTSEMLVRALIPELLERIKYNFDLDYVPHWQGLIRIPESQRNKEISLDWKNPTTILIAFYSDADVPQFYMHKEIKLYLSGPE